MDGGTFRDVVSARLKLEPLIASSVAEFGCPDTIRKLQEIVQEAHNGSRTKKLLNGTGEFHDVLAAGAGNPLFAYLMLALHYIAKPYIRRVPNLDLFQQRLGRYHPQIVDAIAAGASDAAADLTWTQGWNGRYELVTVPLSILQLCDNRGVSRTT